MTTALLLLLALAAQPQNAPGVEAKALAAQDARFAAMVKGDGDALDPLLDAGLTYHHSTGAAQTKSEFLGAIRAGALRYRAIDVVERKARSFGATVVITGVMRLQAVNGAEVVDTRARFTDVYSCGGGSCVQVAWQNTRIPEVTRR